MSSCVVVIPVYKVAPEQFEIASFTQCLRILNDFTITLITFEELNLSCYQDIAKTAGKVFEVEYFNKEFFRSIDGYNKLCLSPWFYKRFIDFEFMLIYQLDAWVFKNQLQYWCEKDYDYIGSPFFRNISTDKNIPVFTKEMIGIGNGGFSLRKIEYCLRVSSDIHNRPYLKPSFLWRMYFTEDIKSQRGLTFLVSFFNISFKLLLKTLGVRNTLKYFIKAGVYEDRIYGYFTPNAWNVKASIPTFEEALHFSFEVNPSFVYNKNGKLPFGCHAFEKWEFDTFWHKHIQLV